MPWISLLLFAASSWSNKSRKSKKSSGREGKQILWSSDEFRVWRCLESGLEIAWEPPKSWIQNLNLGLDETLLLHTTSTAPHHYRNPLLGHAGHVSSHRIEWIKFPGIKRPVEAAYRFEKWNKLNRTKSVHCNFLSGRLHGPSAPTWSTCRQETWRGIHLCKLGLYGCFARELFQVGFCSLHGASCLQRVEVLSDRNLLAATTKAMKNTETLKHAYIIRIYKGTANSRAWHWLEALCSLRDKAMLRHRRKGHSNCKGDVKKRLKKKSLEPTHANLGDIFYMYASWLPCDHHDHHRRHCHWQSHCCYHHCLYHQQHHCWFRGNLIILLSTFTPHWTLGAWEPLYVGDLLWSDMN